MAFLFNRDVEGRVKLLTQGTREEVVSGVRGFDWNEEKHEFLKSARGVSFEEVVFHIQNGDVLAVIKHRMQLVTRTRILSCSTLKATSTWCPR
jgi:hypothetical protein